jgi:hypothetical protein
MLEKTIISMWIDDDNFYLYLISKDEKENIFLTEQIPEGLK